MNNDNLTPKNFRTLACLLSYGVDNPGEVGSTAVYPPSWIRVNSVRKVANATLQ